MEHRTSSVRGNNLSGETVGKEDVERKGTGGSGSRWRYTCV